MSFVMKILKGGTLKANDNRWYGFGKNSQYFGGNSEDDGSLIGER